MTNTFPSTSWLSERACNGVDPKVFYSPRSQPALKICAGCPVQGPCLEQAMVEEVVVSEVFGVRGGKTCTERRKLLKGRRRNAHSECGTDSGYAKHRREHSGQCQQCLDAHAAAERARVAERRPVVQADHRIIDHENSLVDDSVDLDVLDKAWIKMRL